MAQRRLDPPRSEPWFDRLRLTNVRCFEEVEVPLDPRVTVIIGENGAGKTTIAEALASMSFGEKEGPRKFPFRNDDRSGQIALYEAGGKAPVARWSAKHGREPLPEDRYLFAYGRYRRVQYEPEESSAAGPQLLGPEWQGGRATGLESNLMARVRGRRTTTLFSPNNLYSCERCNTFKSNKWPDRGEYVRPDVGNPGVRFLFLPLGHVRAAAKDPEARDTVRDLDLNRSPLVSKRRTAIRASLRGLRAMLDLPGLTDTQRHEIAKSYITERLSRFSEAINQNVRRVWGQAFPGLKI
jgi:energy-coupling factor transporter ATP-binding protein EcfA2